MPWPTRSSAGASRDAGREDEGALSALLRLVDSTLWTVDPFAHAGEEHMSLLVGHPIVVLRAALRLDLDDPLQPQDSLTTPVAVRLGALAAWQDGLLGFVVDDDPGTVHAASPAALELAREVGPEPWLPRAGRRGGRVPQRLRRRSAARHDAALADHASVRVPRPDRLACGRGMPSASRCSSCRRPFVNATSGVLPRKEVGMRRQWIADALARIAPSFRFGPVLVDPLRIRMPVATELGGSWTWNHRRDVTEWIDEPGDERRRRRADRRRTRPWREEGWLTLRPHAQEDTLVTGVLDRVLALVAGAVAPAITAEAPQRAALPGRRAGRRSSRARWPTRRAG